MTSILASSFQIFSRANSWKSAPKVSCAADPIDIRPALNKLEKLIRKRAAKRPVLVLMGEGHTLSAHIALRQGLMARLLSGASPLKLAYGAEIDHNFLEQVLRQELGFVVPPFLQGRLAEHSDPDGYYLLRASQATRDPLHAPILRHNLLAFCQSKNISIRFNDVAKTHSEKNCVITGYPESYFDASDPATGSLMGNRRSEKIISDGTDGMVLRNRMIIQNILTHQRDSGANVYIQDCGLLHLFGNQTHRFDNYKYEDSLYAQAQKAGLDVLPIFPVLPRRGFKNLPSEAMTALRHGLVIEDISSSQFQLGDEDAETDFLFELNKHSGGEIEIFPDEWNDDKFFEQVREEIRGWLNNIKAQSAPIPIVT